MKKGFSLFTPLVGTSVMIVAIIVASAMIQNDIRLSRGLSASYEQTNQNIAAKLIKAAAEIKIMENIEKTADAKMTSIITYRCTTASSCKSKASLIAGLKAEHFTTAGGAQSIQRDLTAGADGIYNGVTSNIATISSYKPSDKPCTITSACDSMGSVSERFDCCLGYSLGNALTTSSSAVNVKIDSSTGNKLSIQLDNSALDSNAFSVQFENKNNNLDTITLSIVPHEFPYSSTTAIGNYIDYSAEAYSHLMNNPGEFDEACDKMKGKGGYLSALIKSNLDPLSLTSTSTPSYTIESKWNVTTTSVPGPGTMVIRYTNSLVPMGFTVKTC